MISQKLFEVLKISPSGWYQILHGKTKSSFNTLRYKGENDLKFLPEGEKPKYLTKDSFKGCDHLVDIKGTRITQRMWRNIEKCFHNAIDSIHIPSNETVWSAVQTYPYSRDPSKALNYRKTAYMAEPVNLLKSLEYQEIVFMGPARTGKSEFLVKQAIAYFFIEHRRDIIFSHTTENQANTWFDKEWHPFLKTSPKLRAVVADDKNAITINKTMGKSGNYLKIVWPSVSNYASATYQVAIATDIDRFPKDIGGEGYFYELLRTRTRTAGIKAKVVVESSPSAEIINTAQVLRGHETYDCAGASIASLFNMGDKRRFYYQCTNCRNWFLAVFETIQWNKELKTMQEQANSAVVCCPHCQHRHTNEQNLNELIPNGRWLKEGEVLDKEGNYIKKVESSKLASFALEAPAAGITTLSDIIFTYLKAEKEYTDTGSEGSLKSFFNTHVGRPYLPKDQDQLRVDAWSDKKIKHLPQNIVPADTRIVITTVDIQNGKEARFVVQVHAITETKRVHLVNRTEITEYKNGRVAPEIRDEDFHVLIDRVLNQFYLVEGNDNLVIRPHMVLMDSGGQGKTSENAYQFKRYLIKNDRSLAARFTLVKGMGKGNADYLTKMSAKSPVLTINTTQFKNILSANFQRKIDEPHCITFPNDIPNSIFDELESEKQDEKGNWVKISRGRRNEAIDLFVYCYAYIYHTNLFNYDFRGDISKLPDYLKPIDRGNSNVVDRSYINCFDDLIDMQFHAVETEELQRLRAASDAQIKNRNKERAKKRRKQTKAAFDQIFK